MHFRYVCNDCGHAFVSDKVTYLCPVCSVQQPIAGEFSRGNLIVEYDQDELRHQAKKPDLTFHDFFPYEVPERERFPVGNTPLVRPARLAERYGLANLTCKLDGALPSGSFKDRASQLIAAQALAFGEHTVALASTGNAGAAMSCAGAAYGLRVVLFVPETAPVNKLMQSVLYGSEVVPVKGTYDDAFSLSIAYTNMFGGINRNTAYNPMTIEGKKSVSIELYFQMGRAVPDVVYVPVGDGCIFAGVYKGFHDLRESGLIDRMPHLVCVQSSASNAISQAWKSGQFKAVKACTLADSISVSSPANGRMAVRRIHESDGWAIEVDDDDMFEAQLELAKHAGLFVEPAAACAWAGARQDAPALVRRFGHDVSVSVLLTGVGFKDMKAFSGRVALPPSIENSVDAVRRRFS